MIKFIITQEGKFLHATSPARWTRNIELALVFEETRGADAHAVAAAHGGFVQPYGKLLGTYANNWRRRTVEVWDQGDPKTVVTRGIPFGATDGSTSVICEEGRNEYERQLVHNDWTPYD